MKKIPALIASTSLLIGSASFASEFTPAQINEMRSIVIEEILNNPQTIIDSLQKYEIAAQQKRAEELSKTDKIVLKQLSNEIYNNPNDPTFVNESEFDGTVIVEFYDYNCKFCRMAAPAVREVVSEGRIKKVYKEYPILSEESFQAALVSLVVYDIAPNRWQEFHYGLLSSNKGASIDTALALAEILNLDVDLIKQKINDKKYEDIIIENSKLANNLSITGTPSYVLRNEIIRGVPQPEELKNKLR